MVVLASKLEATISVAVAVPAIPVIAIPIALSAAEVRLCSNYFHNFVSGSHSKKYSILLFIDQYF